MDVVRWVLEQLRKHGLYTNLKKCRFHEDEVRFLGFVVSAQGIRMEEKRIEAVKDWPEPQLVRNIQVFLGFANFYRRFIRNFSRITAPLTSMLRTTDKEALSTQATENERNQDASASAGSVGGGGVDGDIKNLSSVVKSAKSKKPIFAKTNSSETDFLTTGAREAFIHLRKAFTKAPILRHFDPERHIWIKTDASGYAIGMVLSQMTSGQPFSDHVTHENHSDFPKSEIGQWHPVAFFSRKMIPAETRYETHDQELLTIFEAFKTWRHYLEGCNYEVLVLTDHNNLRRFMDTKNLSSRQVRWAQELSQYHFRIDYRQGKANAAADTLFRFPQRSQAEEEMLQDENTQILHRLQTSLTRASLAGLSLSGHKTALSPLHQVLICETHALPRLCQF